MSDDPLADHPDVVSILNATDRQYLLGESTTEGGQQERDRRQRIRDRTSAAFADLALLFRELSPHDRELIFEGVVDPGRYQRTRDPRGETEAGEVPDLVLEGVMRYRWLVETIAFLYAGCRDIDLPFERVVEEGIKRGEHKATPDPFSVKGVSLDIEHIADTDLESALRTLKSTDTLSEAEYYRLVTLFFEEYERFVEELRAIEIALEAMLEARERLTRGQALVLLARTATEPSLRRHENLTDCLPDQVVRDFGLQGFL